MKNLQIKIDQLYENASIGLLTKQEILVQLRSLRNSIIDRFGFDSDEYNTLIGGLIDVQEVANEL